MSAREELHHQKSEYEGDVEEEEEVEPLLKYNRIGNDIKKVLNDDPASCLCVHGKFLALGSHKGTIYIFDHEGNTIYDVVKQGNEPVNVVKKFVAHEITVNQISVDEDGEYIASCGDDGKVVVHGLYDTAHELNLSFPGPVKAVAVHPLFSKKTRQLATGHDKFIIQEKVSGFLGTRNETYLIHQGEGLIRCIKWCGNYIAWANDKGVKVYDTANKQRISHIKFSFGDKFRERQDLYKCSMCWKDDSTLLIAWGNEVKICHLAPRNPPPVQANVPKICANISKQFVAPFFVMGIAPHSGDDIVLLTYSESEVKSQDKEIPNPRPHVRLIEPGLDTYTEKANDALGITSYEKYRASLYALEWVKDEDTYFIVSPYDVLVAKPRTEDDHIAWLVRHKMFEEALRVVQEKSTEVKQHSLEAIGHMYLDHLYDIGEFEEAAKRSVGILKTDKEAWENNFYKFRSKGKAKVIARYLPRENPTLKPAIYELVLYEFLRTNVDSFQQLLKTWDSSIYSPSVIINAIIDHIQNGPQLSPEELHSLYECLAVLYTNQHNYSEAFAVYLKLKHDDIFPFINKHNLFTSIHNKIDQLMEFNTAKTLNLLMKNLECIAPQKIVAQLEKTPEYQFRYLHELWNKYPNETTSYHTKMVYLYAEYSRRNLLTFLKKADGYDQTAAMKFCENRDLTEEKIYLLGKMGNHRQALHLIMKELKKVDLAIQFCQEHNYESLWEELITYSLDKPDFITVLLKNVGSHIDPLLVIQRIKEGMEIPDLRNSLVKILHDYNLQMSLREDCQKILLTDIHHLVERRIRDSKKAFFVEDSSKCGACHSLLLCEDLRYSQDVCVFYCHHSFHKGCLPLTNVDLCPVCNAQKRGPVRIH